MYFVKYLLSKDLGMVQLHEFLNTVEELEELLQRNGYWEEIRPQFPVSFRVLYCLLKCRISLFHFLELDVARGNIPPCLSLSLIDSDWLTEWTQSLLEFLHSYVTASQREPSVRVVVIHFCGISETLCCLCEVVFVEIHPPQRPHRSTIFLFAQRPSLFVIGRIVVMYVS